MGLFELFREKQIKITPETQVTIKYFTAEKPADLFALAEGDVLLVKKQINNRVIRSFLHYIPYAVLTAMTIPAIFFAASAPPGRHRFVGAPPLTIASA